MAIQENPFMNITIAMTINPHIYQIARTKIFPSPSITVNNIVLLRGRLINVELVDEDQNVIINGIEDTFDEPEFQNNTITINNIRLSKISIIKSSRKNITKYKLKFQIGENINILSSFFEIYSKVSYLPEDAIRPRKRQKINFI